MELVFPFTFPVETADFSLVVASRVPARLNALNR